MEQCNQFKHLLEAIKKHTDDVRLSSECFAFGTIKGYAFRLFQELNTIDSGNNKYEAYLCIKDEKSVGGMWSAFYNASEIDEWVGAITNNEKMKYEPELGQAVFGQPHQEFGVSGLMAAALRDISREWDRVMWNRWQRTIDSPFNNTGAKWSCDTFEVEAYSWAECDCDDFDEEWSQDKCTCGYKPQTYNFKYKDIEISWYKYLGRGMSQNRPTSPSEIAEMLESCLNALKNVK